MSKEHKRSHVADLRGAGKLAIDATKGITSLVEAMHQTIGGGPEILGKPLEAPTQIATDIVYSGIRAITSLVGLGVDGALKQLAPLVSDNTPGNERAAVLAVLNGVLGDYLKQTQNPLATTMRFVPREISLSAAGGKPWGPRHRKLLIMVHGSCMNDRQWSLAGHNHGEALARDLGFAAAYLHYNSGLHISTNGCELAHLIDELVSESPTAIDEIAIVGHSMGGLVARSACEVAEKEALLWRDKLRSIVFLGTPHHGSPLERAGNWADTLLGVSRYSAPLARLGKIRSAGVTDLRYGNVLNEHWQGRDRFQMTRDDRVPLPLPEGVACFAIAGSMAKVEMLGKLPGDGLVPVKSALGEHASSQLTLAFPEAHKWVRQGITHAQLLSDAEVYRKMHSWLEAPLTCEPS